MYECFQAPKRRGGGDFDTIRWRRQSTVLHGAAVFWIYIRVTRGKLYRVTVEWDWTKPQVDGGRIIDVLQFQNCGEGKREPSAARPPTMTI